MRFHKICAVPATAHQLLQQVVKPRKPQRGIDRIARESRHFVRTVSNFWMANWANSNLSATALLQTALSGKQAISAGVNHRLYDHALVQCHRTRTARGQRPESESPESLETLKSTSQIGIGVSEANGLVLKRSADPAPWSKRMKASFCSAPVLLRKMQNDDPMQEASA